MVGSVGVPTAALGQKRVWPLLDKATARDQI